MKRAVMHLHIAPDQGHGHVGSVDKYNEEACVSYLQQ